MRKSFRFLTLLAISLAFVGSAFAYNDDGNPSTKRSVDGTPPYQAYREYQLVRYAENQANATPLTAGDVVVRDCVSDDQVSVGLAGTVGSADAVAGVVVSTTIPTADVVGTTAQTDYGRRNWGYIQVRGLNTNANMVGTAPGAGGTIRASDTARNATTAAALAGSNSPQGRVMGFAYDASTDAEIEIDL